MIVHFVESMGGIRAVQAFRREPRNQEIFDDVNDQYRAANLVAFRLVAWFMPGIRLIGNITIARGAALRRLPRLPRRGHRRRARGVPALPAAVLRADDGDLAVLQHLPVRLGGAGEARRRARGGARRCPSRRTRCRCADPRGELPFDHVGFEYVEGVPVLPDLDLDRPGRPDAGPGRHHRRRQDHAGQAGHPLLRPDRRPGAARRRRPARPLRRDLRRAS